MFANTMQTSLKIREAQNDNPSKEIAHGNFHFVDQHGHPMKSTSCMYQTGHPMEHLAETNDSLPVTF